MGLGGRTSQCATGAMPKYRQADLLASEKAGFFYLGKNPKHAALFGLGRLLFSLQKDFARQAHATLFVHFEDFDAHFVAFF